VLEPTLASTQRESARAAPRPTGNQTGRATDQADGLAQQIVQQPLGVGFGREAARLTQQRFASTMQLGDALGSDQRASISARLKGWPGNRPRQPAWPAMRCSASPSAVSRMKYVYGPPWRARTARHNWTPFMRGIIQSLTNDVRAVNLNRSQASAPLLRSSKHDPDP